MELLYDLALLIVNTPIPNENNNTMRKALVDELIEFIAGNLIPLHI